MRIFLVVFSLLSIAIFAFHFQSAIYEATTQPWTELLAVISAKLITIFDSNAWADGVQILTDPSKNHEQFLASESSQGAMVLKHGWFWWQP